MSFRPRSVRIRSSCALCVMGPGGVVPPVCETRRTASVQRPRADGVSDRASSQYAISRNGVQPIGTGPRMLARRRSASCDHPCAAASPGQPTAPRAKRTPTHGSPHAPRLIGPTSSAQRPVVPVPGRIGIVPAPLPDIAEHVLQAPCIGFLSPARLRRIHVIEARPGDALQGTVGRSARPGAAGVFPFCFRGQAVPLGLNLPPNTAVINGVRAGEAVSLREIVAQVDRIEPGQRSQRRPGLNGAVGVGRQLERVRVHGPDLIAAGVSENDLTGRDMNEAC